MCSGCGVCSEVCPKSCIVMEEDEEGFIYPKVDASLCIGCDACKRICHYNHLYTNDLTNISIYASQYENRSVLMKVSSGGVSFALMESIIDLGGVVYGAVECSVGDIRHKRCDNHRDLEQFCGSKYLQSDIRCVLAELKEDIKRQRKILFTGTPCQIAAVKAYVGSAYNDLYTCEVICHGVPSGKVYRKYIEEVEHKQGKKIVTVKNRNKDKGWNTNQYAIEFEDGEIFKEESIKNNFHFGYLEGLYNRLSCSDCKYSSIPRIADITLGDFWLYNGCLKFYNENKGISLVVINSNKGKIILDYASEKLLLDRSSIEEAMNSCRHLYKTPKTSNQRAQFFSDFDDMGFLKAYKIYKDKKKEKKNIKAVIMDKYINIVNKPKDEKEVEKIKAYMRDIGEEVFFPQTIAELLYRSKRNSSKTAIVSNINHLRICNRLHIKHMNYQQAVERAPMYFVFRDVVRELTRKGVGVYFINRVGKIKTDDYFGRLARQRMYKHLGFPVMSENKEAYTEHFRELLGDKYSLEYIDELKKIPQIVDLGKRFVHEDSQGELVNVIGGLRATSYSPDNFQHTLHMYGRCGVFGYAVEDSETIPSQLQKKLTDGGLYYRIVNHGLWGAEDSVIDNNFFVDALDFNEGDIVLFYRFHFDKREIKKLEEDGLIYKEINEEFFSYPESRWCFYDEVGHLNRDGYKIVANLIFEYLKACNFECGIVKDPLERSGLWSEYIEEANKTGFNHEIEKFIENLKKQHPLVTEEQKCGAIVMNCNPFTKGHRYLIEYASKRVDRLYIFVVEEDKSFFRFNDRYEMVKKGTDDIQNVVVAPSGKFMISALTFPEYFMKDYVKEKNFDASSDLGIFCDYIAPGLNIGVRFAGEEPNDVVTNHYNEEMKRLLPEKGVEFVEIPRLKRNDMEYISATKVRKYLNDRKYEEIKDYVPESTYDILKNRGYFK